jgi:uncharacterized protein YneF (UPF0154 family)
MSDAPVSITAKTIPPEIRGWNWGAFLLNWIWGVGNNTFIALLTFIPVFGLIMPFVLGAKGNAWAWRNGRWDSVEHFKRVQRRWAIWGAVIWIGGLVLFGGLIGGIFLSLKHSEAYIDGVARLQENPIAVSILGSPITAGFPSGSISYSGATGTAALSFPVTGPKAKGTVFVEAIKKNNVWSLTKLALKVDGRDSVINLITGAGNDTT